ncbi:MAG: DivIVA domain-containing protein [Verrucomicrobiales bacterium]|jgi:DivIVA domain-containing protein
MLSIGTKVWYNCSVHLTPEQIDRQPFRTTRRGYDIVQVRNFLREIAAEMRARQEVREKLAANGVNAAVAENEVHEILAAARERADGQSAEILAAAQVQANNLIEKAELTARERSDVVLTQSQARLDRLLEEERVVHARVQAARAELEAPEALPVALDARDIVAKKTVPDSSLADFMKTTLRHEVRPD